jgi:hypothetical protein
MGKSDKPKPPKKAPKPPPPVTPEDENVRSKYDMLYAMMKRRRGRASTIAAQNRLSPAGKRTLGE